MGWNGMLEGNPQVLFRLGFVLTTYNACVVSFSRNFFLHLSSLLRMYSPYMIHSSPDISTHPRTINHPSIAYMSIYRNASSL
jgi:hypothetical protein